MLEKGQGAIVMLRGGGRNTLEDFTPRRSTRIENAKTARKESIERDARIASSSQSPMARKPRALREAQQAGASRSPTATVEIKKTEEAKGELKLLVEVRVKMDPKDAPKRKGQLQGKRRSISAGTDQRRGKEPVQPKRARCDTVNLDDDEDDADILAVVRSSLHLDITSMRVEGGDKSWLSDSQIFAILTVTQKKFAGMRFIDPALSQRNDVSTPARLIRKFQDNNDVNIIMFPICNGGHWYLLTIQNNAWELYDPLMKRTPQLAADLAKEFKRKLTRTKESEAAPRQRDNWNCGVFIVKRAETILTGQTWFKENIDLMMLREELVQMLEGAGYNCVDENEVADTKSTDDTRIAASPVYQPEYIQFDDVFSSPTQEIFLERTVVEEVREGPLSSPMFHH